VHHDGGENEEGAASGEAGVVEDEEWTRKRRGTGG